MHEVLVNRLGGLSQPRKSVVRLTGRPGMTFDVKQQCNNNNTLPMLSRAFLTAPANQVVQEEVDKSITVK